MYYCGLDVHAKSSAFCLVNRRGKKIAEGEVPRSRRGFEQMMQRGDGEAIRQVLEASTRSLWAAEVLEGQGRQ